MAEGNEGIGGVGGDEGGHIREEGRSDCVESGEEARVNERAGCVAGARVSFGEDMEV